MKIKNMKLMLLGLLAMVGMNAYAQHTSADKIVVDGYDYYYDSQVLDEKGRSVNNIVYDLKTVTWKNYASKSTTTKEATVIGVNSSASDEEVATIAIPAKVNGDKGEYLVTWINNSTWVTAQKDVTAVTTSLSLDLTNVWPGSFSDAAYSSFSNLTSLTIKEASESATPNASVFDGSACAFQATLTTLDITESRITEIAANGLAGYTALTGFSFGNVTTVGDNAFDGDYGISTLTIPATVTSIGADAFANMDNGDPTDPKGLTTLTINGYNKVSATVFEIPNAFSGNTLLSSLTIGSTVATSIAAGAFANDDALETIDLSGATALETAAGAFDGSGALNKLVTLKMAGTKMTDLDIDFSASNQTLATLTFPAGIDDADVAIAQLKNFVALTEIDLSATGVTVIPTAWFEFNASETPSVGTATEPSLTTVALNPNTTEIGDWAFAGESKLATITGLNQDKLQTIKDNAFRETALTAIDLSGATNAAFVTIDDRAFAYMPNLATITLPAQITTIAPRAFSEDANVTSINLEALEGLTVLNPIFHDGVVGSSPAKEVPIKLATLTLPENLTTITSGALQLLDITEIVIPASVTYLGSRALQGCIKLENFTWDDAMQRTLNTSTFLGDDHLKSVKMITMNPGGMYTPINIINDGNPIDAAVDKIFKGNKKDELTFTVNTEDLAVLEANGWTEANLKYCTLSSVGASEYAFNEKAKAGEYYYATYYNKQQASWFPAESFDVFSAIVDGPNVQLVPATAEEGYYKVAKFNGLNRKQAVCIIRSKQQKAEYELKNAGFNDISTMPTDNGLNVAGTGGFDASRLKFQYKLGVKSGVVAFYRIATGKFAEGVVYIDAENPKDRLNIVFEGEATAIQAIENEVEDNNAPIYNLNGVRVNKAGKGVYIQNGKKFVK